MLLRSSLFLALFALALPARAQDGRGPELPHALKAIAHTRKTRLLGAWGGYRLRGGGSLLAFSAPGRQALSCDGGGVLRIWDLSTGRQLRVFTGPQDHVTSAAFSPDGRLLATGASDGTVVVREAHTGLVLHRLRRHRGEVSALALSPDARLLVSAGEDALLRIWNVGDGVMLGALEGHTDWIRALAITGDGKQLFSASDDGSVRIWDLPRRRALQTLGKPGGAPVTTLALAPGGRTLASVEEGVGVRLWSSASDEPLKLLPLTESFLALTFEPDGQSVWTVSSSRRAVRRFGESPSADPPRLNFRRWAVGDGIVSEWSEADDGVAAVALGSDATSALVASWNVLRVYDLLSRAPGLATRGHSGRIEAVAVSPVAPWVLTAARDGTARIWDMSTGAERVILESFGRDVKAAVFSPDGKRVLIADVHGTQKIWDAASGDLLSTLGLHRGLHTVAFASDGATALSASYDRMARWDAATGRELGSVWFEKLVSTVVFSTDGARALVVAGGEAAQVRSVLTGDVLAVIGEPHARTRALALSPNGALAALAAERAGGRSTIELWDLAAGRSSRACPELPATPDVLAFSPDGKLLLSGAPDGVLRMWAVKTCKEVDRVELAPNGERPTALAFAPDGLSFVAGSSLGAVHQYLFVADPLR